MGININRFPSQEWREMHSFHSRIHSDQKRLRETGTLQSVGMVPPVV